MEFECDLNKAVVVVQYAVRIQIWECMADAAAAAAAAPCNIGGCAAAGWLVGDVRHAATAKFQAIRPASARGSGGTARYSTVCLVYRLGATNHSVPSQASSVPVRCGSRVRMATGRVRIGWSLRAPKIETRIRPEN